MPLVKVRGTLAIWATQYEAAREFTGAFTTRDSLAIPEKKKHLRVFGIILEGDFAENHARLYLPKRKKKKNQTGNPND